MTMARRDVVLIVVLSLIWGASLGSHLTSNVQPIVVGTASTAIAAIVVTPLGVTRLPLSVPGWKEDWSLVALGVVLLGEPLRLVSVAGLMLILAGVALAGRRRSVGLRRAALPAHDVPDHG